MRLILIRHGRPEWHLPFLISLSQFEHVSAGYDAAHLSSEGKRAIGTLYGAATEYHLRTSARQSQSVVLTS
jgi:hypothetical protein